MSQQQPRRSSLETARGLRNAQTVSAARFWDVVRDRRLDGVKFRRQHRIGNGSADCADFYCHEHKRVVESDGDIHDEQAEYDALRDAIMNQSGPRVLRIKNDELRHDREGAIARVRAALRA